jgi:hypothetical protein
MVNEKRVKTDDAYHFYHNTTLYYSRVDQYFIKFTLQNRKEDFQHCFTQLKKQS